MCSFSYYSFVIMLHLAASSVSGGKRSTKQNKKQTKSREPGLLAVATQANSRIEITVGFSSSSQCKCEPCRQFPINNILLLTYENANI